jgi:hypothetical protein
MVHQDIIFTKLRIEEDKAAFAGAFTGREDNLVVGFQMAAAIRAEEIVRFHD